MRIEVRVAGGVTGAQLGGAEDTATLPPSLAEQVERCLRPERLARPPAPPAPAQPDERTFTVVTGGRRFERTESELDGEQVDALDGLLTEIARRHRARRQAET